MPERERVADARFGKNDVERVISRLLKTEDLNRLFHTLRCVIEVWNTGSDAWSGSTARSCGHKRFKPLPLKRHPALNYANQARAVPIGFQLVFAPKVHGSARRGVYEEQLWRCRDFSVDLSPRQRQPV